MASQTGIVSDAVPFHGFSWQRRPKQNVFCGLEFLFYAESKQGSNSF